MLSFIFSRSPWSETHLSIPKTNLSKTHLSNELGLPTQDRSKMPLIELSTFITPIFGLIVVNGAADICGFAFESALRSVLFPAFGNPIKPTSAIRFNSTKALMHSPRWPVIQLLARSFSASEFHLLSCQRFPVRPFPPTPPFAITSGFSSPERGFKILFFIRKIFSI